MNKKILSCLILFSSLFSFVSCNENNEQEIIPESNICYVNFMFNYSKETIELSSEKTAKANGLLYTTFEVEKGSCVTIPTDPERANFKFNGWYLEASCETVFNFGTKITSNIYLYANWIVEAKEIYEEPTYTPPSHIDNSISSIFEINGVLNCTFDSTIVNLTTGGIKRLENNSENCLSLLNYKIKEGTIVDECKYNDGTIIINAHNGDITYSKVLVIIDNTKNYLINNSTYESKAKNYESNAGSKENYHVMLAGSSSIENWSTSSEDMMPIISYNHGIGGTTVEQWSESLNERLLYPFNPKLVCYYVGINNVINSKEDTNTIYNKLEILFNKTHQRLPDVPIYYILMNLVPGYVSYYDVINGVNDKVITFAENKDWLNLIDAGTALLKENGLPSDAYFLTDGLHMSKIGYVLWGQIVKNSIIDGLEKL